MALIKNANNIFTKGINEGYGILSTGFTAPSKAGSNTSALGAMYDKFKRDAAQGARVAGGIYTAEVAGPPGGSNKVSSGNVATANLPTSPSNPTSTSKKTNNTSKKTNNGKSVSGLNDIIGSGVASGNVKNQNQLNQIKAITSNWDDTSDSFSNTKSDLNDFGDAISSKLGKAADAYRQSNQNLLDKKNAAVAGNKKLISKNQNNDMHTLANELQNNIFNANLSLGAAAGGSAADAVRDIMNKIAGKQRQKVLTGYGDQISQQNQAAQDALEAYNTQKQQIDDWEARNKKDLMDTYNSAKDTLDRLKRKVPDWKQKDIEDESSNNLKNLISGLSSIDSQAKGLRDTLSQLVEGIYEQANSLDNSSIGIDTPAALDTPQVSANLNMPTSGDQTDQNATDFYNPNATKKIRQGTDILGNPFYIDENGNEVDQNGNPVTPATGA